MSDILYKIKQNNMAEALSQAVFYTDIIYAFD